MSQLATTERHAIRSEAGKLILLDCECLLEIADAPCSREGILALVDRILAVEVETPTPDERALSFTCAALDAEARIREERDLILQSLCAQIEIYLGRTPLPETA